MSAFTDSRPWLQQYPEGVPADVDLNRYSSLVQLLNESFVRHADKPAYTMMGRDMTYAELDRASRSLAAYLQQLPGMQPGDRVAVMMPNILQYPIAVAAILRAGLVLVNVNPLYTARELELQL